jgi:hypothetical protein
MGESPVTMPEASTAPSNNINGGADDGQDEGAAGA